MHPLALRLYEAYLRYPPGQEVHTAASGRITALHEVFLEIEDRDAKLTGVGEVRANIAFITGTEEDDVLPGVLDLCRRLDLTDPNALAVSFDRLRGGAPKICCAVVDNAVCDLEARRHRLPAASYLGGQWVPDGVACNNCVFWGEDADMQSNLARYVALGFGHIKLRVGVGTLEDDLRRLAWMREAYGPALAISIDANGAWNADQALFAIDRMRRFDLEYVEQPTVKGDWPALERVATACGLLVMIDEGLRDDADVERVCANGGRIAAHLKIAKAGGVSRMVQIGRRLDRHGAPYVVGQMNEGAIATAVAVHAAMALSPRIGELYGALGIENDAGTGVIYEHGRVSLPEGHGIGVTLRRDGARLLWCSDDE
jgi:L-alanine-DL-glutamate epimerase-like enolase superfamily enzyme